MTQDIPPEGEVAAWRRALCRLIGHRWSRWWLAPPMPKLVKEIGFQPWRMRRCWRCHIEDLEGR